MKTFSLVPASFGGTARRRPPYFRTKKLALVGSTKSVIYAPWDDPSWTIAAHPCSRQHCKREPDWYFDLHRPECFQQELKSWNDGYYSWLKKLQTPVFMQEDWPEIPMAVRYPLERMEQEYKSTATGRLYATNHVAYMVMLAMSEGVTHVGLFGCQYSADTEHGTQRGSCEYWLGRFEQAGGIIVLPSKHNNLLQVPKGYYGYESHDARGKLLPEYLPAKLKTSGDSAKAPKVFAYLNADAEDDTRVPLMTPPKGVHVAWQRSGLKAHG